MPDIIRGACLAAIAPGGLVPVLGFFLALGAASLLRLGYDTTHPLPIGDLREPGRNILQASLTISLTFACYWAVQSISGTFLLPAPDGLGPVLRWVLMFDGALLSGRHGARLLVRATRKTAPRSSIIPEIAARPPIEFTEGVPPPPIPELERDVPELRQNLRGEVLVCAGGLGLFFFALRGWNMASLCLLKLPG